MQTEEKELTNEERVTLLVESASVRITIVAVNYAVLEMINTYMYDAKYTDRKTINQYVKVSKRFFYEFEAGGHHNNTYHDDTISRLLTHAGEFVNWDDPYPRRRELFSLFVMVLDLICTSWQEEAVFTDKNILYRIQILLKPVTRHFSRYKMDNVGTVVEDVVGHISSIKQETKSILMEFELGDKIIKSEVNEKE